MGESAKKEIISELKKDKLITLVDKKNQYYLYYDRLRMLIPILQDCLTSENISYEKAQEVLDRSLCINGVIHSYKFELIRAYHAVEVFSKICQINEMEPWNINDNLWLVNSGEELQIKTISKYMCFFNGKNKCLETICQGKGKVIKVVYLPFTKKILAGDNLDLSNLNRLGLTIAIPQNITYNDLKILGRKNEMRYVYDDDWDNYERKTGINIDELLDCDKRRCGLASYEKEILYDVRAGHWDLYENIDAVNNSNGGLIGKDPRTDIKKNGVIGIDFGTKSTVVVKQEGKNEIRPIRIGSLSLTADVKEDDYENPTIISCMSINDFLEKYEETEGRPETSCEDIFVSYNAYEGYINCPTENFYGYYTDLKQWANSEKEDVIIQDIKDKSKYWLREGNSIESSTLNPIEIYAYYIGMYINNMRNGIYLKYIMSFPVKYSKETKELIRKSFEKGIRKSLPRTVIEDQECMSKFSIEYGISEPAAYAVTALEQSGYKPQDENEKYLYGIFDFGGGTTDFDFGVWRGASDEEYDKYNCDYILECFGADSDVRLGGENILEMLAYNVFKDNKNMAASKRIACALPVDQVAFIGGESLLNNSQSANRNLTLLKEALRPLWEQHDSWEERYKKVKSSGSKGNQMQEEIEEYIELQMYDFNGKAVPNCKFDINTEALLKLIKDRIQKGVDSFFGCIEKSILFNKSAQFASEKIYIFLAGNSCKSAFVKELFEKTIEKFNKEYGAIGDKEQDRFELIEPLKSSEMDSQYIPNAKTSVAYGLVKSRPGGKIFVKKNYETDSTEETRFKYYLGNERRGNFECKFIPTMMNCNGESQTSYNVWHKFQGAGMGIARIYYTPDPRADAKINKISIDNIPFHEISFEADENMYLFVRAVTPSVIEYAVAETADKISQSVVRLDLDAN